MQNIGIILYTQGNNEKNLSKSLSSLLELSDKVLVVCDGELPRLEIIKDFKTVEFKKVNYYAGCVNHGIRHFLNTDVEHIFVVNDNVMILDKKVFKDFINVNEQTNLDLMVSNGMKDKNRLYIDLKDGYQLDLVSEFDGYVIYLNTNTVKKVGFFDERYKTTFELLDYYKRSADTGVTTPFGWFATISNVKDNIFNQENKPNTKHKVYTSDNIEDRIISGMKLFKLKYKAMVNDLTNIFSKSDVVKKLKLLVSRK